MNAMSGDGTLTSHLDTHRRALLEAAGRGNVRGFSPKTAATADGVLFPRYDAGRIIKLWSPATRESIRCHALMRRPRATTTTSHDETRGSATRNSNCDVPTVASRREAGGNRRAS
jgi:hypothetical protein